MSAKGDSLFSELTTFAALCASARRASKAKRLSKETARFLLNLEPEVFRLQRELRSGSYRPAGYRTFQIRDPKPRTISAAPFRDRVVHHGICAGLEPIFERRTTDDSHACRQGKGMRTALKRTQELSRASLFVLKLDIRHFFETVDHRVLETMLRETVADSRLREVAMLFVRQGAPGSELGQGLPIGNLTSQHYANFYLTGLDRRISRDECVTGYCRYMDDMLIFGQSKAELWSALGWIQGYLGKRLKLRLRQEVTRLIPVTEGIPFLGFRIWPSLIRFDPSRARRFRRRFRALDKALDAEIMSEDDAARSAQSLLGWAAHGDTLRFRKSFFTNR